MAATSRPRTSAWARAIRCGPTTIRLTRMGINHAYEDLLSDVLENGTRKTDRTGTGTLSVFGRQIRYNLAEGFPRVTTKFVAMKAVKGGCPAGKPPERGSDSGWLLIRGSPLISAVPMSECG